jgi:hypothetical protein
VFFYDSLCVITFNVTTSGILLGWPKERKIGCTCIASIAMSHMILFVVLTIGCTYVVSIQDKAMSNMILCADPVSIYDEAMSKWR